MASEGTSGAGREGRSLNAVPLRWPRDPLTERPPRPPIDWNAVGRTIGSPLKTEEGDVHTAEFLRSDLHVVNAGVTEIPAWNSVPRRCPDSVTF
jgi:hypothetical protein